MKKAIYRSNYMMKEFEKPEREQLIGYDSEYLWKSVDHFKGPKQAGRYLVIKKDGHIEEMYCTGMNSTEDESRALFYAAVECDLGSGAYIDDREMTDADLMGLYRSPWGIWYTFVPWQEYDNYGTNIHAYTSNSEKYPLYFLDLNLDNKIDLDENGEIAGVSGVQYCRLDTACLEYVKEE